MKNSRVRIIVNLVDKILIKDANESGKNEPNSSCDPIL